MLALKLMFFFLKSCKQLKFLCISNPNDVESITDEAVEGEFSLEFLTHFILRMFFFVILK